jgi:ABC-type polysaccharide/polyol phosphate export permease
MSDDIDIGVDETLEPGTPGEHIAPLGSHPDAADTGLEEIEDGLSAADAIGDAAHPAELSESAAGGNPLARFPEPVLPDKPPAEWRYRRAFQFGEAIRALGRSGAIIWGLIVRQLRSTYSQQVFGLAWTVLTPVAQMVVFTFVINRVNSGSHKQLLKTAGVAVPVWLYVSLLIWGFYSSAVSTAGTSLVGNPLLNKVYAPREVFPIAQVATSGFDALVSTLILPVLLLFYWQGLTWSTLWAAALPVAALILYATAMGLVVAGVTVYARDLRSGLPILMSLGMWMPGVLYSVNFVIKSHAWQTVYAAIFPVGQLADSTRLAVLAGQMPHGLPFWVATLASCIYAVVCFSLFKRMETGFADVS